MSTVYRKPVLFGLEHGKLVYFVENFMENLVQDDFFLSPKHNVARIKIVPKNTILRTAQAVAVVESRDKKKSFCTE